MPTRAPEYALPCEALREWPPPGGLADRPSAEVRHPRVNRRREVPTRSQGQGPARLPPPTPVSRYARLKAWPKETRLRLRAKRRDQPGPEVCQPAFVTELLA